MASTPPKITPPLLNSRKDCRPAKETLENIVGVNQSERPHPLSAQSSGPNALDADGEIEQGSSGDEWGMEIGNLIIDLDADLEKDEMKEKIENTVKDCRNSNNNNSTKGSAGSKSPGPSNTESQAEDLNTTKCMKTNYGSTVSQTSAKTKSKAKKSLSKTGCGGKFASVETNEQAGIELCKEQNALIEPVNESTMDVGTVRTKLCPGNNECAVIGRAKNIEGNSQDSGSSTKSAGKFSKPGRSSRKQVKVSCSDKKYDMSLISSPTAIPGKELREKTFKSSRIKFSPGTTTNVSQVISSITPTSCSLDLATEKCRDNNSPCSAKSVNPCTNVLGEPGTNQNATRDGKDRAQASLHSSIVHSGGHRKTSSVPAPMKLFAPSTMGGTGDVTAGAKNAKNFMSSTMDLAGESLSGVKRVRNPANNAASSSIGNKKIKLDKVGSYFFHHLLLAELE